MANDDKPNLASIDVGFKPSKLLLDTADLMERTAAAIRNGEVYSVAFAHVGKEGVYHCVSIGKEQFALNGAISYMQHYLHGMLDKS